MFGNCILYSGYLFFMMIDNLIQHIKRFVAITLEDEEVLRSCFVAKDVRKKQYLLEAGEICTQKYFVSKGVLRMYNVNDKGVEQVIHFAIEGWWMTDYFSYNSGRPSQVAIQAVEASEIIMMDKQAEQELFAKIPVLESYFRRVLEKAYAASIMRTHYIFNFSAEERYRHFAAAYPGFIQRVPQYLLASYLGFTPEFLSKVRAKKE